MFLLFSFNLEFFKIFVRFLWKMVNPQLKIEFLKVTKIAYFIINLITFNFGKFPKINNARKFISLCLVLSYILLAMYNLIELMQEKDVFLIFLEITTIFGLMNILANVITICYYEEDIIGLLQWMEDFYFDDSQPILTVIKEKILRKTLWILKFFLKYVWFFNISN